MSTAERRTVTALLTAVTLAAVLLLALVGGPTGGAFLARSTALAAGTDNHLRTLGAALPFGYAFGAGMLAAFNPCGFGLVPAYLGLHLGRGRLLGAARFGIVVSLTIVLLFAAGGLALAAVGETVARWFPWIGLVVAGLMIGLGAHVLTGGAFPGGAGLASVAGRLGRTASAPGAAGAAAFGLAFALTSLGCTLPLFLSVLGASLTTASPLAALAAVTLFGLGLSAVLVGLGLAAALLGTAALSWARGAGRLVEVAAAALLLLGGAYAAYYWLTIGGLLG
jgi:cytochrome c-type biogenesis protein